ncbi:DinB family protein [Jeotgalibacillus proteolyticus]|uniref:DinB family protein n=1 Tax=Jeotgalibacillus proteolyticus TaxID=2082395 RepID=UPI003CE67281
MIEYRIRNNGEFSAKIGELAAMLEHTRTITLKEVMDLGEEELDALVAEESNSVGALLRHIAAIEYVHQVITFEDRDLHESELDRWKMALELGEGARKTIHNHTIQEYINELAEVREKTLSTFKKLQDEWLFKEKQSPNGIWINHYYLWYHVMEDEISHRGQIRMIKRMLKNRIYPDFQRNENSDCES